MQAVDTEQGKSEFIKRHLPRVERSDGTIEEFIPERIYRSMLKETSMPDEIAIDVTNEMMVRLINMKQEIVTAPFIREQACNILYFKNPTWRMQYTRLGMPYHDFKELCGDIFDKFNDWRDIHEEDIEKMMPDIGDTIKRIVTMMARDYVGVRDAITNGND